MFTSPINVTVEWVKSWTIVQQILNRKLSFLTIHYIYLISLALIGSVIIKAVGGIRYIDSLFFASGAVTQAGLNTIDVNTIHTSQQMVLYFTAMLANPIFINTVVVFVRLYWFEKRFRHIVKEARAYRRTRSRSKTETKDERDAAGVERGVGDRSIVVLHENGRALGDVQTTPFPSNFPGLPMHNKRDFVDEKDEESPGSSSAIDEKITHSDSTPTAEKTAPMHRDIQFADLNTPNRLGMLQRQNTEQHIAFLENQRNPKDKGALRIPGPRDYDQGHVPQRLEDDSGAPQSRRLSIATQAEWPTGLGSNAVEAMDHLSELNGDDHIPKRTITIDDPIGNRQRSRTGSFSRLKLRKPLSNMSIPQVPSIGSAITGIQSKARSATWTNRVTREINEIPYLSYTPTIGRNSAFINLTEEQREELGGIEYRALKTLAVILVSYFICFHTLGWVCLLPWIKRSSKYGSVVTSVGQGRPWWAFFTAASHFNDLGFTLTPDSMMSFQAAIFPLLLGSFLIIIGNTGFPCMLRFVIWVMSKLVPVNSGVWEELRFLLDHPRRCFTLLFPSTATWWLFWILVLLNGLDLVFFVILDLNDAAVTSLPPGIRVLDGWYQATSTRTAGFGVVNLALLHPAIQVSYMIMMYISVFPIAISVRRTNVYEEQSLGIWGSIAEDESDAKSPSYVGAHLRKQLSFDLWYLFLGLFIIAIAEGSHLQNVNEYSFTVFSVLFEIVSAYGTVGMSLGYPGINASFSGVFSSVSKLVIIAMQIRGRHRGLPYELDRAILLPSESLHQRDDEDARRRAQRRNSSIAPNSPFSGPVRRSSNLSSLPPLSNADGAVNGTIRPNTAATNKTGKRLD